MIQIINGQIRQTELPTTGIINGSAASNYNLLPLSVLEAEGWVDQEVPPQPLETLQRNKIAEFNMMCNQTILAGFDSDAKGTLKHYDFTTDDQINMLGIQNRVFGAMLTNR